MAHRVEISENPGPRAAKTKCARRSKNIVPALKHVHRGAQINDKITLMAGALLTDVLVNNSPLTLNMQDYFRIFRFAA